MNQFKKGDKAVIPVEIVYTTTHKSFVLLPNGETLYIALENLMPCVDAVDRIPSLGEQEEMINTHLRVEPTPTREQVLLSNIDSNERRIESEWSKSEPNLDRINMLSQFINENKLELKNIQSVKN